MTDIAIMRRRRSFVVKVIAVCFIALMLLRTDWLAVIFIKSSQSSLSMQEQLLADSLEQSEEENEQHSENAIRAVMEKEKKLPACPIPQLKNRLEIQSNHTAHCQRIKPSRSVCKLAEELFGNPANLDISKACRTHKEREYCRLMGSVDKWTVTCDISVCDKRIYLGIIDVSNGKHTWTSHRRNKELQQSIQTHIDKENFGYCLIACSKHPPNSRDDEEDSEIDYGTEPQILNLPPLPPDSKLKNDNKGKFINFNFIFIDSVARHHFYRSLPRSVKRLNEMAGWNNEKLLVLDFELVQGVRSRTFETLQTLFSGSINPFERPFGTQEMPRQKMRMEELLVPLKDLGYSSLWLEDLCPYWEWGLSKDILAYNRTLSRKKLYKTFMNRVKRSGIDSIGNTFSSCDILHANEVPDPFHAPAKVCYNGKHQHEYILSYLETYQQIMTKRSRPFISFLETNVGHEGTGKRIQYLDSALSYYLRFVTELTNTITIVFSDHGNAYGEFLNKAAEGRIEIYHPLLFMIIPEKVQSFFSESQLHALKVNQKRLVSVLDLHYTVTAIIEQLQVGGEFRSEVSDFNKQFNVSRSGLLSEISPERTCSHMPRIMPNSCICEGYDVSLTSEAYHFILAAYFVGMMNNKIQKTIVERDKGKFARRGRQFGGFGSCQRMKVKKIKNIQESKLDDTKQTAKMDLYVDTDGQIVDEIFFISLDMKKDSGFSSSSFDRVTPYSKYSTCADAGVDLKLCVCKIHDNSSNGSSEMVDTQDRPKQGSEEVKELLESMLYSELRNNITSVVVDGKECLYVISQSNKAGIIFEAINNCKITFQLKLLFQPVNLVLSSGNQMDIEMHLNDVTFLTAGVRKNDKRAWSCGLTFSFDI